MKRGIAQKLPPLCIQFIISIMFAFIIGVKYKNPWKSTQTPNSISTRENKYFPLQLLYVTFSFNLIHIDFQIQVNSNVLQWWVIHPYITYAHTPYLFHFRFYPNFIRLNEVKSHYRVWNETKCRKIDVLYNVNKRNRTK